MRLEASAAKKPLQKRPKSSNKEEEWVEVSARKNLQKKKRKKADRTPKRLSHARPEAVLIKSAEGKSYASILCKFKKRVNPDKLGATDQRIRDTRSQDLLAELKFFKKTDSGWTPPP